MGYSKQVTRVSDHQYFQSYSGKQSEKAMQDYFDNVRALRVAPPDL